MSVTLDDLGRMLSADQSSLVHNYLRKYEEVLGKVLGKEPGARKIAIIGAGNSERLATAIALWVPNGIEVTLLRLPSGIPLDSDLLSIAGNRVGVVEVRDYKDIDSYFISNGATDILIEDGHNKKSEKREFFNRFFWTVNKSGFYIIEDLHASSIPELNDDSKPDILEELVLLAKDKALPKNKQVLTGSRAELRDSIRSLEIAGKLAIVEKEFNHFLKISEDYVQEPAYRSRMSNLVSDSTTVRGSFTFHSNATFWTNTSRFPDRIPNSYLVPEMTWRVYDDVTVVTRQIMMKNGAYLPETFRLFRNRNLPHHKLHFANQLYAREFEVESPEQLKGYYYMLDNEFAHQFGHCTSEIINKAWAIKLAKERYPDLKILISSLGGESINDLKPWVPKFLKASGVELSDIVVFDAALEVEHLITGTQLFSNLGYASPECKDIWESVTQFLKSESELATPKRIFVSRKGDLGRVCRNGSELEALFEEYGFSIVYPEEYSLPDQAALFSNAEVVAGYGGSGLINTFYCKPDVTKFVFSPDTYNAINEALIHSILGGEMYYYYCDPEIKSPGRWTIESFSSPYSFNFEQDGQTLKKQLESLGK